MGLVVNVREHKTGEAPFMRSTSCSFHCSRVKAVQNMTDLLELSRQWIKSWGSCCLIKNSTAAIEHASLRNWFCAASLIGPNSFVISAKPWDQVGGSKKNNPVQQKRCLSIEDGNNNTISHLATKTWVTGERKKRWYWYCTLNFWFTKKQLGIHYKLIFWNCHINCLIDISSFIQLLTEIKRHVAWWQMSRREFSGRNFQWEQAEITSDL